MSSRKLTIDNKYELLALHRGLMEARFCPEPNDMDVSGSPILAALHRRLMDVLLALEPHDSATSLQWKSWLQMDVERRHWGIALGRARNSTWWKKLTIEERKQAALDLLAPFSVTDELIELFLQSVG
jgi:hypothetical protein